MTLWGNKERYGPEDSKGQREMEDWRRATSCSGRTQPRIRTEVLCRLTSSVTCDKTWLLCLQGEGNVEYFLGLTPTGIVVYKNKNKVGNYFWWVHVVAAAVPLHCWFMFLVWRGLLLIVRASVLALCQAQHGCLYTSCRASLVELRSLCEHTGSFAHLL